MNLAWNEACGGKSGGTACGLDIRSAGGAESRPTRPLEPAMGQLDPLIPRTHVTYGCNSRRMKRRCTSEAYIR